MLRAKHVLLASHGTQGARAAEKLAFSLCAPGASLHHLIVVPDFWKGMMGDDWLNNAATREIYGDYVETQLENEVRTHIRRLRKQAAKRRIRYDFTMVQGKPTECLAARAAKGPVDIVVLGSPRPRGKTGYRSGIELDKLARRVRRPILIAPFPK
ncbi:MAG: universal stress protein [Gammaproteobacteria bacterium]|nr:universal stress protein [Gammaproteobacteria bacterium]